MTFRYQVTGDHQGPLDSLERYRVESKGLPEALTAGLSPMVKNISGAWDRSEDEVEKFAVVFLGGNGRV